MEGGEIGSLGWPPHVGLCPPLQDKYGRLNTINWPVIQQLDNLMHLHANTKQSCIDPVLNISYAINKPQFDFN